MRDDGSVCGARRPRTSLAGNDRISAGGGTVLSTHAYFRSFCAKNERFPLKDTALASKVMINRNKELCVLGLNRIHSELLRVMKFYLALKIVSQHLYYVTLYFY